MREKKTWRKSIDHASLQQQLEQVNREKEVSAQRGAIPDSALFTVNNKVRGGSLRQQREKLRQDRFKEKEYLTTSKYEEVIVKKLTTKPTPPPKKVVEEEDEIADLWGQEGINISKNQAAFRNFTERSRIKVKPVVVPLSGQSYNPSAKDHKEVI